MKELDKEVYDLRKFKMIIDKNDLDISKQVKDTGWYQDEIFETTVFQKYLKPNMNFLDLGANIGFYTLLARSIIGEKGKIMAFEPFLPNVNLIRESAKINSFENIVVVEAAVGSKNGKAILHVFPNGNSENTLLDLNFDYDANWNRPKELEVELLTVDTYLEKIGHDFTVDFIKMDIEGYETEALKGMKRVFQENKNLILMTEFWPNGFRNNNASPEKYLKTIDELGFDIFHLDKTIEKPIHVTLPEIKRIMEEQCKSPKDEIMKQWGWYTNLLCIKNA